VLPKSVAFDFLLFCERNPQPLPLLEVCEVGCTNPSALCIAEADIRSDLPAYNVYREGKLEQTTTDITDLYPSDGVAFLYGCSFSVDCVLAKNKIPQRSLELKRKIRERAKRALRKTRILASSARIGYRHNGYIHY